MCDQLARNLTRQFGAAAIHGDKSQADRDHVLNQFRSGRTPVLVATDVAARGLDVKDIRLLTISVLLFFLYYYFDANMLMKELVYCTHWNSDHDIWKCPLIFCRVVVNFDFPTGVEDYVHRIGRTGRAGATGIAYTFFGDQDAKHASDLIKILEGANQRVPPELRELSSRGGGGFSRSKYRTGGRGDSGFGAKSYDSGYGGKGNDGGYGGRGGDSNYGGRGGYGSSAAFGRGGGRGFDSDSQRFVKYLFSYIFLSLQKILSSFYTPDDLGFVKGFLFMFLSDSHIYVLSRGIGMIVIEALTEDLAGVIALKLSIVNAVVVLSRVHHLKMPRSAFTKQ